MFFSGKGKPVIIAPFDTLPYSESDTLNNIIRIQKPNSETLKKMNAFTPQREAAEGRLLEIAPFDMLSC